MSTITKQRWAPINERQRAALRRSEFEVFIGGERGGGKSEVGRAWLIDEPYFSHPQYRCLVLRKNSADLDDWIFKMKSFCPSIEIGGNPCTMKFPSGGRGTIGHLANHDSWTHYVGAEYHKILFEEINIIPDEQRYLMVLGSCRSSIPELKPQCMSSGNPGNVGHIWVKKRFVDVAKEKTYIDKASGLSRIFIPLKLRENYRLPGEYEQTLRLLPVAIQRAWIEGDWDALAGQMFSQLPEQEDPFILKGDEGELYASFDFGSSEHGHSSFGMWLIDNNQVPHRLFTWYHKIGHTAGEQAQELLDYVKTFPFTDGRFPKNVYADPAIFAKNKEIGINSQPKSVADYFKDVGLNMVPANNNRVNGWVICQDYFSVDPMTKLPKCKVWSGYNNVFYDHFALQVRDDNNPDDIADNNFDHVCDETRYGLTAFRSLRGENKPKQDHNPYYGRRPVSDFSMFRG
jgi:hypothetical protein